MQLDSNGGEVLRYRLFRLRHGIPLHDIAKEAGLSVQRISQIELAEKRARPSTQKRMAEAMQAVIVRKKQAAADALEDYQAQSEHLFDMIDANAGKAVCDGSA